ncbi:hypothetical protein SAMN05216403_12722 [Nitrosospira multiformis ATCC 25196]|uniref:Phage portal protein n=1 Tax=Nitrosospira multiformis (strain ATCC 25196 / NCIMB 11849 / C 71) TaxID=323848 RepID=Q2Y906_NITMU|nr:hypothetical protein [Nitrosospira multiformis]ABB74765.1 putative phage portal protein [Nitrosospira multiformis ATCC 25196]SEG07485.1 hypothetical protein SAMN05216403_12722 [Nitrosospira multiformis ATCC 25196]
MTEAGVTADISIEAYDKICRDIRDQPKWRSDSDTDCDYYDGAQTSSEVIGRLKMAGIPPQDSNLIKPTINAVLGLEARSRTDYRVTADDESQAEIAEGLSAKIKEAETESRADRAMSDAYSSMIRAGIGWVEISREFDALKYPYRVREVHRNEIYWDWSSREPDLSDARYLRRDKWIDRLQAALMFPDRAEIIANSWKGWNGTDVYEGYDNGLARAYEIEQAWNRTQEDYLNRNSGMVRLSELWYRHFEDAYVLVLTDGKIIEYREDNPYHQAAVAQGLVQVQKSVLTRMRVSIWLGPHKLMDVPSPLPHSDFPYVPFWCFRKDRSRAPYGLIRDMRGPQDQIIDLDILLYEVLNSVKVEVDNDALDLSQNSYQEVANNISSLRSMTILNSQRRNTSGFRVIREHQLAAQVFQLVQERKRRIEEVGGIYRTMLGAHTSASSGVAINSLVEQGSTVLAEPNDNFRHARRLVGQQLLALIKEDLIGRPAQITVQQGNKPKVVYFNRQLDDGLVHNDIASAMVKVVLEDIPATPTFRAQQLQAMSQIVQAAPPRFQAVLYPVMLELSNVPNRHELAHQLRQVAGIDDNSPFQALQQQVQQMIQEAQGRIGELQQRLGEAELQLKACGLDLKARAQAHKEDMDDAKFRLEAEKIADCQIGNALSA